MIKTLLNIRWKQIYRALISIGLLRSVFVLGLLMFLLLALFIKSADAVVAQYASIACLVAISAIHLKRRDKLFLKTHFSNWKILMLVEYLLCTVPILISLLIHGQWYALLPLLGLLVLVYVDFKPRYSSLNTKLQRLIPSDAIEWKAGVRQQFFFLIPVWIIAVGSSFFMPSIPVAMFIIGLSVLSFYESCEPFSMLLAYELDARSLLYLKVKRQFQLYSIAVFPLMVLFMVFHADKWYIPVALYLIFCFLNIYVIMTKYAFYLPNGKSPAAQTFVALGILGGLIPVLLPVVWGLTIWFYIKSLTNLNIYLYDYNK